MKIKALLYLIFIFQLVYSQDKVNIKLKNQTLNTALIAIQQQTNVQFSFNPKQVNIQKKITVDIKNQDLSQALALLLIPHYAYTQKGKYVIITSQNSEFNYAELQDNENELQIDEKKNSGIAIDDCLISREALILRKEEIGLQGSNEMNNYLIKNKISDTMKLKQFASIVGLSTLGLLPVHGQKKAEVSIPQKEINYESSYTKAITQISFVYPLGTDGATSMNNEYKYSFNLLGGMTGAVNGLEIGGIFNINEEHQRGAQFAGLFNFVKGNSKGFQAGGLFNVVLKDSEAIQLAGFFNYATSNNKVQIAGTLNLASEEANVQISTLINYAQTAKLQLGVINKAKKSRTQIGILNLADTDEDTMIGLFNIVKQGGLLEIGASVSDYIYGATHVTVGTDKMYTIISMGVHSSTVSFGWGLGKRFNFKNEKSGINAEITHHQIFKNNKVFDGKYGKEYLSQIKVLYGHRVGKVTYLIGPSINGLVRNVDYINTNNPIYSIVKNEGNRHNFNLWVGLEAGIRFNLR